MLNEPGELVHSHILWHRADISRPFAFVRPLPNFLFSLNEPLVLIFPLLLSDFIFCVKITFVKPQNANKELILTLGLRLTAESLPPRCREIFYMRPLRAYLL